VTGSLIPKAQIETASPVVTITAEDIQRNGFKNVYDALRSLPTSVGSVQDNQFTNSFTPGASTVSLLGLDPSFTLVLMNGKPMADYPFLYNSNSNFVDLNTIPNFMVDHIDILPGNQSAIYGSAAIAGVINIVLKQKMKALPSTTVPEVTATAAVRSSASRSAAAATGATSMRCSGWS
jgi:outer membrane receptor for ferrienterochelin and colicin